MRFKYKIGDTVTIRQEENIDPSWDFDVESMGEYCGSTTKITRRIKGFDGNGYYNLAADDQKYLWTEEMLMPENKSVKQDFIPEIELRDVGMWLLGFSEESGIGKIEGNFSVHVDGDLLDMSADLEGGRHVEVKVTRKES